MSCNLSDYLQGSLETGVGLALKDSNDEYLFFLPGKKFKSMGNELFYAGIGGHLEDDESLITCANREVKEELDTEVEMLSSEETWHIHTDGKIEKVEVEDFPKPLGLYDMLHAEGTPKAGQVYKIVIFEAKLYTKPENLQKYELGGVIALTKDQVIKNINRKPTLHELIDEGASIVAGCQYLDFNKVKLYPIGTAKALGYILNSKV